MDRFRVGKEFENEVIEALKISGANVLWDSRQFRKQNDYKSSLDIFYLKTLEVSLLRHIPDILFELNGSTFFVEVKCRLNQSHQNNAFCLETLSAYRWLCSMGVKILVLFDDWHFYDPQTMVAKKEFRNFRQNSNGGSGQPFALFERSTGVPFDDFLNEIKENSGRKIT